MTNLRFSTNIAVYLSYGIRQLVAIDHKDEVIDTSAICVTSDDLLRREPKES